MADLLVSKVFAELPLMTEPKGVVVDVLKEGSKMKQKEWKEWNGLARWMEVESTLMQCVGGKPLTQFSSLYAALLTCLDD